MSPDAAVCFRTLWKCPSFEIRRFYSSSLIASTRYICNWILRTYTFNWSKMTFNVKRFRWLEQTREKRPKLLEIRVEHACFHFRPGSLALASRRSPFAVAHRFTGGNDPAAYLSATVRSFPVSRDSRAAVIHIGTQRLAALYLFLPRFLFPLSSLANNSLLASSLANARLAFHRARIRVR